MNFIFNTDDDKILEEKLICYQVSTNLSFSSKEKIILSKVVNRKYKHPQAPEDAFIWNIEIVRIKEESRFTSEASALELLLNAQNNISLNYLR